MNIYVCPVTGDIVKVEIGQDSMDNSDGGDDMMDDDFSSPGKCLYLVVML